MSDSLPITLHGKLALEEELRRLKNVERPAIIKAIEIARAHGDLSENAEYHAAREKQSFCEGRILDIGDKIARAEVIDVSKVHSDKVQFGATVSLSAEDGHKVRYQIVGEPEADLSKGLLSVSSPVARALLGKRAGDEAIVKSPKGELIYEIVTIEYL